MKKSLKSMKNFIFPKKIGQINFLLRILFWLIGIGIISYDIGAIGEQFLNINPIIIEYIGKALMCVGCFTTSIARLRDLNHPTWFVFAMFSVPIFGFLYLLFRTSAYSPEDSHTQDSGKNKLS